MCTCFLHNAYSFPTQGAGISNNVILCFLFDLQYVWLVVSALIFVRLQHIRLEKGTYKL